MEKKTAIEYTLASSKSTVAASLTLHKNPKKCPYSDVDVRQPMHSFIKTLHHAFAMHRTLYLQPDDILLLILHGIANLTLLQPKQADALVKGSAVIKVDLSPEDQADVTRVCEALHEATRPFLTELANALTPTFSTTTPVHQVAHTTALFSAVADRFVWIVDSLCLIPKVTLLGTVEDWRKLHVLAERLDDFGCAGWSKKVQNFTENCVTLACGRGNVKWWKSVYKYFEQSGNAEITGHCLSLFPVRWVKGALSIVDFTAKEQVATTASFPSDKSFFQYELQFLGLPVDTVQVVAGMCETRVYEDGYLTMHGFKQNYKSKSKTWLQKPALKRKVCAGDDVHEVLPDDDDEDL